VYLGVYRGDARGRRRGGRESNELVHGARDELGVRAQRLQIVLVAAAAGASSSPRWWLTI